ncbi:hypothetical protein BKA83DRAFT_4515146 [Pisolithus microcarpus]|nr:hypothetical protein BKA83DRAFT_4515146 [Pisolithus microcarpus]
MVNLPFAGTPLRNAWFGPTPGRMHDLTAQVRAVLGKRQKTEPDFSDSVDEDREEFNQQEAYLLLDIARAQATVRRLERQLVHAKLDENIALGNLYKCRAQESERRLENAEAELGCICNSIRMSGGKLCDDSARKHRRHVSGSSSDAGTSPVHFTRVIRAYNSIPLPRFPSSLLVPAASTPLPVRPPFTESVAMRALAMKMGTKSIRSLQAACRVCFHAFRTTHIGKLLLVPSCETTLRSHRLDPIAPPLCCILDSPIVMSREVLRAMSHSCHPRCHLIPPSISPIRNVHFTEKGTEGSDRDFNLAELFRRPSISPSNTAFDPANLCPSSIGPSSTPGDGASLLLEIDEVRHRGALFTRAREGLGLTYCSVTIARVVLRGGVGRVNSLLVKGRTVFFARTYPALNSRTSGVSHISYTLLCATNHPFFLSLTLSLHHTTRKVVVDSFRVDNTP